MPLSYAFADLEVTGGLDGKMTIQSPAVKVDWKWYYGFSTLPLWAVLLLITFLPKQNRQDRIGPILITPLVAEAIYQLLSWNITAKEASGIDAMIYLFVSLAIAWSAVWILAPWLSHGGRFMTVVKQFMLMFFLGMLAIGGYYGFSIPGDLFSDGMSSDRNNMFFITGLMWACCALSLVGNSFLVSLRRSSRITEKVPATEPRLKDRTFLASELKRSPNKSFRPMLRMLLVLPLIAFAVMCLFGIVICLLNCGFTSEALREIPSALAAFWPAAIILACFIYLLNVPICLSGHRWPAVKERWLASFPIKKTRSFLDVFVNRLLKIAALFFGLVLVGLFVAFLVFYVRFAVTDHPQPYFQPGLKEIADKDNAAAYYRKADRLLLDHQLIGQVGGEIRDFFIKHTEDRPWSPDRAAALLAPYEKQIPELMKLLHRGAACPGCVWKTDFAQGPYYDHFLYATSSSSSRSNMRFLGEIGLLQTLRLAEKRQFDKAIECWADSMTLLRFHMQETLLDWFYDRLSSERQGLSIAAYLAPQLTHEQRAKLRDALENLPARKLLAEMVPLHTEAYLRWAKNNPVALIRFIEQAEMGCADPEPSPGVLQRILAGWYYREIDWQRVESLLEDDKKLHRLCQQYAANRSPLSKLSLTEKTAVNLSGGTVRDEYYQQAEQAAENVSRMLRAGLEILDGGKPDEVLKKDPYRPGGWKEPCQYKSGKQDSFSLTTSTPKRPDTKSQVTPSPMLRPEPLTLRFGLVE